MTALCSDETEGDEGNLLNIKSKSETTSAVSIMNTNASAMVKTLIYTSIPNSRICFSEMELDLEITTSSF